MKSEVRDIGSAGRYLEGLINLEKRPDLIFERMGLGPIRDLLDRLGNPEKGISFIHVAGSKGKGSTCLFAEGALAKAGIPVGVFTSPHLVRWNERFRIGGREVDSLALTRAVAQLQPHVDWLRENDPANAPTFFDATTAAALLIFAEAGLTRAILEVGLGGRLDSTNVITPAVTCITSIELEHTDKLGHTIAAIAGEKAGILKHGVPCFIGALPPEAEEVVCRRASELGVRVGKVGEDFERLGSADIRVLGGHQLDNASIALAAVREFAGEGQVDFDPLARRGIAQTQLPGRIEVLRENPWTIVDGAHTRASAISLAAALPERVEGRSRLLLSISGAKDQLSILDSLIPLFDHVTVTCADPHRSIRASELAAMIGQKWPTVSLDVEPDPHAAARALIEKTQAGDLLCAAGSIYIAGIARQVWLGLLEDSSPDLH